MPRYRANPVEVEAARIVEVAKAALQSGDVWLNLEGGGSYLATPAQMARIRPAVGDYVVTQDDGYVYLNPRAVFERKYLLIGAAGAMTFGDAIARARAGDRISRLGWNGKGMWLALQVPDAHSKMSLPYLYMKTAQGDLVPWLASQTDMLADDWLAVEASVA